MDSSKKKWYAVYTRPRWEKKVFDLLIKKEITAWCPLQKKEKQWSDRKKIIEEPLFRSYVFVYITEHEQRQVLWTDGVINFIYYLNQPAVIRDEEIELIKLFLADNATLTLLPKNDFSEQDNVLITVGVFMDTYGIVKKIQKNRVYVELKSLDNILIVDFPKTSIQKIS